jgi:sterol desaturase/sphingolipid hydroxylase (fatty acid hydroxylase superfamily)
MHAPFLIGSGAGDYLPWLLLLLGLVLLVATLEGLVQSFVRHQDYDWRAYATSVADMVGRRLVDALGLSLAAPVFTWAYVHRLGDIPLSNLATLGGLFLAQEFFYYWYHRAAHRVGWFWATHCVHHSPQQLTLVSALRLGWTGKLTGTGLFFVPLVWLGFPPAAVAGVLAANLLYQFWLHATWIPKLGALEWVFNTPSHHRVHHGSNTEYLDCNYGGVLIVFDRLFGTFVEERADIAIRYGLVEPMATYNPLRLALHGWWRLGRAFALACGWRARWAVLCGPPGGQRGGRPVRSPRLPVDKCEIGL